MKKNLSAGVVVAILAVAIIMIGLLVWWRTGAGTSKPTMSTDEARAYIQKHLPQVAPQVTK